MKHLKTLLALCLVFLLASCSKNNTFVISGSFDVPMTFEQEDGSTVTRDAITGSIYLLDVEENLIDSATIAADETFQIQGICDPAQPYFAFVVCEYGAGMLVIEPGTINVSVGNTVEASGTPLNDQITLLMTDLDGISSQMFSELSDMFENVEGDAAAAEAEQMAMPVYTKYMELMNHVSDSVYQANSDNLVGVYVANMQTVGARTSDELKAALDNYSEYVQNSELMQMRLHYMELEDSYSLLGGDDDEADDETVEAE